MLCKQSREQKEHKVLIAAQKEQVEHLKTERRHYPGEVRQLAHGIEGTSSTEYMVQEREANPAT